MIYSHGARQRYPTLNIFPLLPAKVEACPGCNGDRLKRTLLMAGLPPRQFWKVMRYCPPEVLQMTTCECGFRFVQGFWRAPGYSGPRTPNPPRPPELRD